MAAGDAAGATQFLLIVPRHRMRIVGVEVIDAETVAAVFPPGTVQVAPTAEMQTHMGAAPGRAEEDQIAGAQQLGDAGPHRHGLAEALLQVGVARQPHADGQIGRAHV